MKKWSHLVVGICFLTASFLPVLDWTFVESGETSLSFTLKSLTYAHRPGSELSQIDNKALFWLTLALGILHGALGLSMLTPLLKQKLYNASALLSSALIFSIIVTSYRAEKSILMDVASRTPGIGAWLLLFGWLGSLFLYWHYRKSTSSGQQALSK